MATDATVDITTASRTLGLSVEALRKRLQRGAARGYKASDGTWRVFLDGDPSGDSEGAPPGAGALSAGAAASSSGSLSGGAAGLAAEVSALREDVRILKSHLGDLRRALEETVSGHAASPAVPSLASPTRQDGPVLEQPSVPSGEQQPDARDPDMAAAPDFGPNSGSGPDSGDESPWTDADTNGWDIGDAPDDYGDPFAPAQDPGASPIANPIPDIAPAGLDDAEIRRMIDDKVDEKLKPALEVLREALLAMRKSR